MAKYGENPEVIIDLPPGLYLFDDEALGKTYLYKVACGLSEASLPVYGYSYSDYKKSVNLKKELEKNRVELLVIDRFDQYI